MALNLSVNGGVTFGSLGAPDFSHVRTKPLPLNHLRVLSPLHSHCAWNEAGRSIPDSPLRSQAPCGPSLPAPSIPARLRWVFPLPLQPAALSHPMLQLRPSLPLPPPLPLNSNSKSGINVAGMHLDICLQSDLVFMPVVIWLTVELYFHSVLHCQPTPPPPLCTGRILVTRCL